MHDVALSIIRNPQSMSYATLREVGSIPVEVTERLKRSQTKERKTRRLVASESSDLSLEP